MDNNLNGESGSAPVAPFFSDNIVVAIADSEFDTNHPAWDDWQNGPSRLRYTKCWNKTTNSFSVIDPTCWATSALANVHGQFVAAQALADLTQNQHGNKGYTWEHQRTGMTTESEFIFMQAWGDTPPTRDQLVEGLIAESPDIVNASFGFDYQCDLNREQLDRPVDEAFYTGIFWVSAAGNQYHNGYCNVGSPATAASSFTVGALNKYANNLRTGAMAAYSAMGGEASTGRNLIDAVAIGGRQGDTAAWFNDSYGGSSPLHVGTSFASPVVAGGAANLKQQLVNKYGAAGANTPGVLFATMLLMVDHFSDSGAPPDWKFDPVSGGGRLRMRKLNRAGMDFPWEFHIWHGLLGDGAIANLGVRSASTHVTGNSSGSGFNPSIPVDVEQINVAGFWYEPNTEPGTTPASIQMNLKLNNQTVISSAVTQPGQLRVRHAVHGQTGIIQLLGLSVPPSTKTIGPVVFGDDFRDVTIAWYFEDKDRDDGNGPPASIQ